MPKELQFQLFILVNKGVSFTGNWNSISISNSQMKMKYRIQYGKEKYNFFGQQCTILSTNPIDFCQTFMFYLKKLIHNTCTAVRNVFICFNIISQI